MKRTVLALLEVDDRRNNGQIVDTAVDEINLNCRKRGVECVDALATDEDSDDPNTSPMSREEFKD